MGRRSAGGDAECEAGGGDEIGEGEDKVGEIG
jgi:hypothetical protein